MKEIVLLFGGIYGTLAVLLGAFGAHALRRSFNEDQLKSFETGVRYQMYHSLLLLIAGVTFPFLETGQVLFGWAVIIGVFLFSFSIYGLAWSSSRGRKIKILGPVTPIGGLFLIIGWIIFTIEIISIAPYLRP